MRVRVCIFIVSSFFPDAYVKDNNCVGRGQIGFRKFGHSMSAQQATGPQKENRPLYS